MQHKALSPSLGAALKKLNTAPTPPWLAKPLYAGFIEAVHPEANTEELDIYQRNLHMYLHQGEDMMEAVQYSICFWQSDSIRTQLNSLFFGRATNKEIVESTGLELAWVDSYQSLFCDLGKLATSPVLLRDYVGQYPEITEDNRLEKDLYKLAINYGWEWVIWKTSNGLQGHIPGVKIVDVLSNMAFWKSMEAGQASLGSMKSTEARKFLKIAGDLALKKHQSKMGSMNSVKELKIRLTSEDKTAEAAVTLPSIEDLLYKDEEDDE